MNHAEQIAGKLGVGPSRVAAAIALLDAGNTVPFIARYRKEATGGLDDDQLRTVGDSIAALRALDERRAAVLASIEEQGKLTEELRARIAAAATRTELEDLYLPFKPKRRTRASIARDRGLEPLARLILAQPRHGATPVESAAKHLSPDVPTTDDALAGARDIVAETIADDAAVRGRARDKAFQWATLRAEKVAAAEDSRGVFQLYYDFACRVDRIRPHQVLAVNRGEAEKVLRVRLDVAERDWHQAIAAGFRPDPRSPFAGELERAVEDAAKRLLLPAVERDVRAALDDRAELHAIEVFAENLRGLLTQPPLAGHTVLGIDPGHRSGCKVAVVDATGKLLETATIYPHAPQKQWDSALAILTAIASRNRVSLIAIGNGTASRETEQLAAELIRASGASSRLHYVTVSEAGASVYSASALARAELPDLDVTLRGAVSIARRIQDPLAELVKIEPKAIGVGMYQHDVNESKLEAAIAGVVETVVNRVGVDANTASAALLTHVAGIGPKLADRIVAHRNESGAFRNRRQLLKVQSLGPKAFEQAAGFLRVREGDEPLDSSAIHPESYRAAAALLALARTSMAAPAADREAALGALKAARPIADLAAELGVGVPTLEDIFEQLVRPGRDPRAELPPPILRSDVLSMDDLRPGMRLSGTVRNVVDFGAFVDIGVKQDGLLHRSAWPRGAALGVGDVVEVAVLRIEPDRGRIALGWPD